MENLFILAALAGVAYLVVKGVKKGIELWRSEKLWNAARDGRLEEVNRLLDEGVDPDLQGNEMYPSALFLAAQKGHHDIVRTLLQSGASVSKIGRVGSALHEPAFFGHAAIVRDLIDAGVDVNSRDSSGYTPLMDAMRRGQVEIANMLLEAGADIQAVGNDKKTMLMFAAEGGNLDLVKVVLATKPNVNAATVGSLAGGRTALMFAANAAAPDVVRELLRAGADPNRVSLMNGTALGEAKFTLAHAEAGSARRKAAEEVVELLEKATAAA